MIKIWIKHKIYEKCIDLIFDGIFKNFVLPLTIPIVNIDIGVDTVTISDGKHTIKRNISDESDMDHISKYIYDFLKIYHPKIIKM